MLLWLLTIMISTATAFSSLFRITVFMCRSFVEAAVAAHHHGSYSSCYQLLVQNYLCMCRSVVDDAVAAHNHGGYSSCIFLPYLELPFHLQEWCGSCCGCSPSCWLQQLLFTSLFRITQVIFFNIFHISIVTFT